MRGERSQHGKKTGEIFEVYQDSPLPYDWAIAVSENGWMDDEIGYEWI
jgi:hypothetical protein